MERATDIVVYSLGQFTYVGSAANETSSMHRNAAGAAGGDGLYVVVLKVCHVPRDRRRRPGAQDGLPSRQAAMGPFTNDV